METFSYREAFERNRGLVTEAEQERLARSLAAIAGCGGVGGLHAHTLARLGVGRFRLADFDTFSLANFNRQIGATVETVGKSKAAITAAMVRAINPDASVEIVPQGVSPETVDAFVAGAGVVVDGIDFFSVGARRMLFAAARRAGVPALTAAPLGFGATLHVFGPHGMSFDEYFRMRDGQDLFDQLVNFVVGLAPGALHLRYLDLESVDLASGRGPSSIVGTQLAASLVGAEAVRILLGRGPSRLAPSYLQFDAYRQKVKKGRLAKGNGALAQRFKRSLFARRARALGWDRVLAGLAVPERAPGPLPHGAPHLRSLAAAATLAPSGDNTQPWRFVFDEDAGRIDILLDETRDPSPMNAGQRMARIALGAAVETLLVEAHRRGLRATPVPAAPPALASVRVSGGDGNGPEEPAIRSRVTNRRRYDGRAVPPDVLRTLEESTPPLDGVTTSWITDRKRLGTLASLVGRADSAMFAVPAMLGAFLGKVRLDLAPGAAVADGLSTGSLELSLADRMLLPALPRFPQGLLRAMGAFRTMGARSRKLVAGSSGLCLVVAPDDAPSTDVTVGRALQRAWLALTKAGLAVQPMMSLLVLENALDHRLDLPGLDGRTVVALRDALRGAAPEIAGRRPAALLRFGYAPAPSARVGRLSVEAVTGDLSPAR